MSTTSSGVDRIVVGIDGSDNARQALLWAAWLARNVGAEVVAVHARGLLERLDGPGDGHPTPATVEGLQGAGVRHREIERAGTPVSVLLDVAEEEAAGLIVVGSRGLGGYPELLLGSTSTQVVQRATCPVVVVPTGGLAAPG